MVRFRTVMWGLALFIFISDDPEKVRVTFMPQWIVLKNEHRTSNIKRPTSNEIKSNTEHSTPSSFSFLLFDSAQGREPVERPF